MGLHTLNRAFEHRKEVRLMAATKDGRKFVRIPPHTKEVNGKKVQVPAHVRSTPTKCK